MQHFTYSLFLVLILTISSAFAQEKIMLYPENNMPNSKGLEVIDSVARERYFKISKPWIEVFSPSEKENKHAAVLIIPGGGYIKLSHVVSGTQIAKWYNTMGITAFVLYHRLPNSVNLENSTIAPLQDAQRAMRIIRSNAKKWDLNTDMIGVMGFSAGGHLASTLGTNFEDVSDIGDKLSGVAYNPNFMLLVSPVISMTEIGHKGSMLALLGENATPELVYEYSNQNRVSNKTPPTILFHANNDTGVSPLNSIEFYKALLAKGVSASIHIFPEGGHSIALRNNPGSTNSWTQLAEEWLIEMGFLK